MVGWATRHYNGTEYAGHPQEHMTSIENIPIQPDRKRKSSAGQIISVVSVVISLVALVVSGLSLWQSHQNAALQNEVARPLLEIRNARIIGEQPGLYDVVMELENIGHQSAIVFDMDIAPEVEERDLGLVIPKECFPVSKTFTFELSEVKVHSSTIIGSGFRLGKDCTVHRGQYLRVTLKYRDPTGHSYDQYFNVSAEGPGASP